MYSHASGPGEEGGGTGQSSEHVRQFFRCFIYVLACMPDGGAAILARQELRGVWNLAKNLRVTWKIESEQTTNALLVM